MKEIVTTTYEAFDGARFATASECRAHERERSHLLLVNLTLEQVEAAMSRKDADLADAIELCGLKINRERRADGDLKRQRQPKPASETPSEPPAADADGGAPAPSTDGPEAVDPEPAGDPGAPPGPADPGDDELPSFLRRTG